MYTSVGSSHQWIPFRKGHTTGKTNPPPILPPRKTHPQHPKGGRRGGRGRFNMNAPHLPPPTFENDEVHIIRSTPTAIQPTRPRSVRAVYVEVSVRRSPPKAQPIEGRETFFLLLLFTSTTTTTSDTHDLYVKVSMYSPSLTESSSSSSAPPLVRQPRERGTLFEPGVPSKHLVGVWFVFYVQYAPPIARGWCRIACAYVYMYVLRTYAATRVVN